MYCYKCGQLVEEIGEVCPQCGANISFYSKDSKNEETPSDSSQKSTLIYSASTQKDKDVTPNSNETDSLEHQKESDSKDILKNDESTETTENNDEELRDNNGFITENTIEKLDDSLSPTLSNNEKNTYGELSETISHENNGFRQLSTKSISESYWNVEGNDAPFSELRKKVQPLINNKSKENTNIETVATQKDRYSTKEPSHIKLWHCVVLGIASLLIVALGFTILLSSSKTPEEQVENTKTTKIQPVSYEEAKARFDDYVKRIDEIAIDTVQGDRDLLLSTYDELDQCEQDIKNDIYNSLFLLPDMSTYDTSLLFEMIATKKDQILQWFTADYQTKLDTYSLPDGASSSTVSVSEAKEKYYALMDLYNQVIIEQRIWSGNTGSGSDYETLINTLQDQKNLAASIAGIKNDSSNKKSDETFSASSFSVNIPGTWSEKGYNWYCSEVTQECPTGTTEFYVLTRSNGYDTGSATIYVLAPNSPHPSGKFSQLSSVGTASNGSIIYVQESGSGFLNANPSAGISLH